MKHSTLLRTLSGISFILMHASNSTLYFTDARLAESAARVDLEIAALALMLWTGVIPHISTLAAGLGRLAILGGRTDLCHGRSASRTVPRLCRTCANDEMHHFIHPPIPNR